MSSHEWTPSDLSSLCAWIDASDSSSYSRSGTSLLSVTDKAGTYTLNVAGDPETNLSTQNGLNVFDFDGNGDYLQSTTYSSQVSSGNHWAIGVFKFKGSNSTKDSLWSYETNATPKRDYAVSSSAHNNTWPGELDLDGLSSDRISSTIGNTESWSLESLTRNQYHIVAVWFNKTGNQIGARVDGSNAFTPVNDYDNSLQSNQELRLMRNRASEELDGQLGEFFAVKSIPGTGGTDLTDLIKAEGYLAHKWGLESSLPTLHPYKSSAPADTPTPTPTPTASSTPTPTSTLTPTVTVTPTPTVTTTPTFNFPSIDKLLLVRKGERFAKSQNGKFIVKQISSDSDLSYGQIVLPHWELKAEQPRGAFYSENLKIKRNADVAVEDQAKVDASVMPVSETLPEGVNAHVRQPSQLVIGEIQKAMNVFANLVTNNMPCLESMKFEYVDCATQRCYNEDLDMSINFDLDRPGTMATQRYRLGKESDNGTRPRISINPDEMADFVYSQENAFNYFFDLLSENPSYKRFELDFDSGLQRDTGERYPLCRTWRPTCSNYTTTFLNNPDGTPKCVKLSIDEWKRIWTGQGYTNNDWRNGKLNQAGGLLNMPLQGGDKGKHSLIDVMVHEMFHSLGFSHRYTDHYCQTPVPEGEPLFKSVGGIMGCHLHDKQIQTRDAERQEIFFDEDGNEITKDLNGTTFGSLHDSQSFDPNQYPFVEYDCDNQSFFKEDGSTSGLGMDDYADISDTFFPDGDQYNPLKCGCEDSSLFDCDE